MNSKIKKSFFWNEPRAIRIKYYVYPTISKWSHLFFILIFLIFTSFIFFLPKNERGPIWGFPLMGFIFGTLAGYGIPVIDNLGGSIISITDLGVERFDSVIGMVVPILIIKKYRRHFWKWDEISYCRILSEEFNEKAALILHLFKKNDNHLGVIGLSNNIPEEEVKSFLKSKGCEIR